MGSSGQLGTDLVSTLETVSHEVVPMSHDALDVTDWTAVEQAVQWSAPELLINCAAYVRVDEAEVDSEAAFAVNAIGALNVARACAETGAHCVHISTDYVFGGDKSSAFIEEDIPRPCNVYGVSKLAGEQLVSNACPDSLIVRVASLFGKAGSSGKGGNFVESILAKAKEGQPLRVVSDTHMSPTYTRDASDAIVELAGRRISGIVHVANFCDEPCTWYLLAKRSVEMCGLPVAVTPVSSGEYPSQAKRPDNSVLDISKATRLLGCSMPTWEDALSRYLQEKGHLN